MSNEVIRDKAEIWEDRAQIGKRIVEMRDKLIKPDAWTDEDEANWKKANEDYDAYSEELRRAEMWEEARKVEQEALGPAPSEVGTTLEEDQANWARRHGRSYEGAMLGTNMGQRHELFLDRRNAEDFNLALQSWFCQKKSPERIEGSHVRACRRMNFDPSLKEIEIRLRPDFHNVRSELRNMGLANDSDVVPEGFSFEFEKALLYSSGARQISRVIRTATGNPIDWPTTDDTGNDGALLAELTTIGTSTDLTLATVTFSSYKYSSTPIIIGQELLQDAAFNMATEIGMLLGQRLGRALNAAWTVGTGSSQPHGFMTASTSGLADTDLASGDNLIDLMHSVDIAYRNRSGSVYWTMHDTTVSTIRKFKGTNELQYIWQPGLQAGQPDVILGYPLVVNNDIVATQGDTDRYMAFGDFSKFIIREAGGLRLVRLDERYADIDATAFVAFMRTESKLVDGGGGAIKHADGAA